MNWRCSPTAARCRPTCSSLAAGIAPNTELARDAGLRVNRGVLVDERMRTERPAILAAGDVAEHAGRVHGLWPVAVEQAEVAADNAVGGDKAYRGSVPFTMLKVVGVELTSVGRFEEPSRATRWSRSRSPAASTASS